MLGIVWAQMPSVMVGDACPRSSLTAFAGTPEDSMSEAAV